MTDHSPARHAFAAWVRNRFVEINTNLEDRYWNQSDRNSVNLGADLKAELLAQGERHISDLAPSDIEDGSFEDRFALLGDIGLFMSAIRQRNSRPWCW